MKRFIWLCLVIFAGVYICGQITDPDLWWHITAGRWILANGRVPAVDHWNMFGVGRTWRAYSWSSEVLFAFFDLNFGLQGLLTLKIIYALFISFSLFFVFGKIAKDWFFGTLLGLYSTVSFFSHFTLRPQSLTWAFLAWLLYMVHLMDIKGWSWKRGAGVAVVMCLWANTHITTPLGMLAALLWLFEGTDRTRNIKACGFVLAFCLIGVLFTPYHGGEIFALTGQAAHPFTHSSVVEFQAASINQYPAGFLLILLCLLLYFVHLKPSALPVFRVLLGALFAFAGFAVIKFMPDAMVVLSCLLAEMWALHRSDPGELGNVGVGIDNLKNLFNKIPKEGFSFVVLALIIVNVWQLRQEPINKEFVPVEAVDFIKKHNLPKPVLNIFGDGGYLMYRFSGRDGKPEMLVPVDGRTNVNDPEVARAHADTGRGRLNWREYLELVKPETILWRNELPLNAILLEGDEWCIVFRNGDDEHGHSVYVKREYFLQSNQGFESLNCEELEGTG